MNYWRSEEEWERRKERKLGEKRGEREGEGRRKFEDTGGGRWGMFTQQR